MNIYSKKQRWKLLLFVAAALIVVASLWYTNTLVSNIAREERRKAKLWADAIQRRANLVKYTNELFDKIRSEERKKVELWAKGTRQLANPDFNMEDVSFLFEVIKNNETVPVILADEKGNVISARNLDSLREKDPAFLKEQMALMKQSHEPIEINIYNGQKNYLYYQDSRLFSELKLVLDDHVKSFISEVAINSASVPVIYTDSSRTQLIAYGNVDSARIKDQVFLKQMIDEMASENAPIEIELDKGYKNYIFYKDSFLLTQLKYYPFVQFGVIGLFLVIAYTLFSTSRKAEQNQVWVGMAKETAHQLGTPLSSLIAWLEYLEMKGTDSETIKEIRQDVRRLETITERFSKIGSMPVLEKKNLVEVLSGAMGYMRTRTSKNVIYSLNSPSSDLSASLNVPLFEWVIENLCRNAVDAMDGKGSITIDLHDQVQYVYIDITDSGKGIPKSKFKTVFEPGYTTKKRGWGLGLSLTRRIIENYHLGRIFVKRSEPGAGTTFRIVLKK
jgi:signal transduction histidine kinase